MLKKKLAAVFTGRNKILFLFILIFLSSIFAGITFKLGAMYQELKSVTLKSTISQDSAKNENPNASEYGKRVSELAAVPAGEVPVEAVVSDVDKIRDKNPSFYTNASKGDILLLYKNIAVIYSVSKDKIVAMMSYDPTAGQAK